MGMYWSCLLFDHLRLRWFHQQLVAHVKAVASGTGQGVRRMMRWRDLTELAYTGIVMKKKIRSWQSTDRQTHRNQLLVK